MTAGDHRDTAFANLERALAGEHVLVGARDASDRPSTEEASRGTDERYRALYQNMLEGLAYCRMLYDEEGHPDDWVYLAANPAFERLTGLKDVIGRRVTEIIPTIKAAPELFDAYSNVVQTGASAELEIDFTPLRRWLRISVLRPAAGHFVAMFADVTERKRAESALRESEDRFKH
jgi:PAS domain S-box-containing protein